jgi:L-ascorbate metabolism protein UlaG (beta-lactamase superfamily)
VTLERTPVAVTLYGHAAVGIDHGEARVLIDPFITGNPAARVPPEALNPRTIVITHAHADHVGDALAIAERSGATIVSSVEIVRHLGRLEGANAVAFIGANIGGRVETPTGPLRFTPAWHSSGFADGTYGGMPMGVVFEIGGLRIYHAGDTGLFGDMALIGEGGLDLALLPIGGHYTMGPQEALRAIRMLRPRQVVPIHYDTFPLIAQDAPAFAAAVHADAERNGGAQVRLLRPGEQLLL